VAGGKIDKSYWLARKCSASHEGVKALAYSSGMPNIFLSLVLLKGQWMKASASSWGGEGAGRANGGA